MAPDLSDRDYEIYFGEQGKGKTLLTKSGVTYITPIDKNINTELIDLLSEERSFSFEMSEKLWNRVLKAIGLRSPKYKKMRKGKRYVWYEKSYD